MALRDQLITDLSVFFNTDEWAETVTYTDKDGIRSADIEVVIEREEKMDPEVRGVSDEIEASATMYVKVSDVPDPRFQDTVVIKKPLDDGTAPNEPDEEETWEVREIWGGDNGIWELKLRRDTRVTYEE